MNSLHEKLVHAWKLFRAVVLGILRARDLRRKLMFLVSMLAMGMAFLGMVVLDEFLTERVALFLSYWVLCLALVFLMLLLAVYDMARVRADLGNEAVQRLGEVIREEEKGREPSGEPVGGEDDPRA